MARHRDNIVAVKEMSDSLTSTGQMIRFVAEMELMANLQHPNILRFEGIICCFPKLCMVLEYAKAGNLRDYMTHSPFIDWRNKKYTFAHGIASAMNYLHTRSAPVLHRDLKTMNVLVTEWGVIKLSDFGESKILTARETGAEAAESISQGRKARSNNKKANILTANLVGTTMFMAPEVFKGEKYTKECDVFSYGCILADIAMAGRLRDLFIPNHGKYDERKMVESIMNGEGASDIMLRVDIGSEHVILGRVGQVLRC